MARLASRISEHRWWVLGIWIAIVIAALPLFLMQSENLTGGGFASPGSEASRAERAAEVSFPDHTGSGIAMVLVPDAPRTSTEASEAIAAYGRKLSEIEGAGFKASAREAGEVSLRAGEPAIVPIDLAPIAPDAIDVAQDLRDSIKLGKENEGRGVTPYVVGQPAMWAAMSELSQRDLRKAEAIGFPLIAIVLITVFGTLIAASLPLLLAAFAVIVTGAFVYSISFGLEMSIFVSNMATMIGIGVAVDYSLFILARYRQAIRAGRGRDAARAEALSTSGLAVTFSGLAVIVSLAGLWLVDNRTLQSMALGAMIVVAVSILLAVTLLPALIAIFGHRVEGDGKIKGWVLRTLSRVGSRLRRGGGDRESFWHRWSHRVMERPVVAAVLVVALLAALIAPSIWIKTGNSALEQMPKDFDARIGTEIALETTGEGFDRIEVVAFLPGSGSRKAAVDLARRIGGEPGVTSVRGPLVEGDRALIEVSDTSRAAESRASERLVNRLREMTIPAWSASTGGTALVGGEPGAALDNRNQIADSMWKIFAFVLCLSYLVLLVLFRSVILPLKAIAMNLLSIGAAYGVLVVVFQWGWLDFLPTFDSKGALEVMTLPLLLAVVFGLSMDYEVFLLSRIKERYLAHGDNRRAVAEGLEAGASTISSAALIMVLVFLTFVFTGVSSIKEIGLGCAVAIAFDATSVRLVLVPATMQLLGRWNWWIPRWLDRVLPRIPLEGADTRPTRKSRKA